MNLDLQNSSISKRFEHILEVTSSQRFLKMESLNNEVPFFICPYKAEDAVEMEKLQRQLINKLLQSGINVLDINLYDISIDILKRNGDWDWYLKEEQNMTKEELKEDLQSILDVETVLVPEIKEIVDSRQHDLVFMSGIGEVYPYIRSHNILNNLQSVIKKCPMIMFFPGDYAHSAESGASLELFGKLHDDKYYRAFNIYNC
ncbi:MAG: DUF1788 domain-containing protein [Candidatus Muiribacteriota bacterium]